MPDATFLHIQDGAGGAPTRVLELPIGPIRVGRGPLCEVRIPGPGLDDVQCILRRRGNTWHYQPVGTPGRVLIEGRVADQPRPLPLGVALRVGDVRLTLRPAGSAADAFGSFDDPIPVEAESVESEPAGPAPNRPEPPRAAPTEDSDDRLKRWQARADQRGQWLKDRQDEKRWEARWKAAGESIRSRSPAPSPTSSARPAPTPPPAPRPAPAAPISRPVEPRPAPSFHRIAQPTPRPTPGRVPLQPTPGPIPEAPRPNTPEPPLAPAPPPTRALVSLPPPPIDWAGARIVLDEGPAEVVELPEAVAPPELAEVEPEPPTEEAVPVAEAVAIEAEPTPQPVAEPVAEAHLIESEPAEAPIEAEVTPVEAVGEVLATEPEPVAPEPIELPEPAQVAALDPPATQAATAPTTSRSTPSPAAGEWPSARSIFAAQGSRSAGPASELAPSPRKKRAAPAPTDPLAPACWTLPAWLGVVPAAALSLVLGAAGIGLSVEWAADASTADQLLALASRPEGAPARPVDPALLPQGGWWRTTAPHLAAGALALARLTDGEDHSEEVRSLLEAARHASPMAASTRFAIEPPPRAPGDPSPDVAHLGRSRDAVTLAWAGRRLREAGKVEASLRAYRTALSIAARARFDESDPPGFDEDNQVRRYRLPGESTLGPVIQGMVRAGEWTSEQWAEALPDSAVGPLVASRVLRRAGQVGEADRLVDLAIARADAPIGPGLDPAEHRAAVAEALAARSRWTDAAEQYRQAIDRADHDATRRRYWLNLAEVATRVGDDATRARAIESARGPDSSDEVTKRALQLQQNNPGLASRDGRP